MKQDIDIKDFITVILTVFSLVLGIVNLSFIRNLEYRKGKESGSHKRINFLLEIDKLLLAEPKLWSIYDSHYITSSLNENDLELRAKKDALFYFILNSFEIIYEDHQLKGAEDNWALWNRTFQELLKDSVRFREIISSIIDLHPNHPRPFIRFLIISLSNLVSE